MHTETFKLMPTELKNYRDLLIGIWPHLQWRHTGIGALQAYIREGDTEELRVHVWHPDLVKPGIHESGLCHDHRFFMRSSVLLGSIEQTEFQVDADPNGDWEVYTVVHAREALAKVGEFHADPIQKKEYYRRTPKSVTVNCGMGYTFDKFAFHESKSSEVTITLVEKYEQENVRARLLIPRGKPLVHAFTETKSYDEFKPILDDTLGMLLIA